MIFIIRIRNSNKEQVVERSKKRRRRINLGKSFKIREMKRKEIHPLKTKGKVNLNLSIY